MRDEESRRPGLSDAPAAADPRSNEPAPRCRQVGGSRATVFRFPRDPMTAGKVGGPRPEDRADARTLARTTIATTGTSSHTEGKGSPRPRMNPPDPSVFAHVQALFAAHPWASLPVFIIGSLVLVWSLESMSRHGLEGTALGTIAMPYCSGLGNLVFVALVLRDGRPGAEVVVNALVNNVTNLTLLLGLPALLWGLSVAPGRRSAKALRISRLNRLSLTLTLAAAGFFAALLWLLGRDGTLDRTDGAVLVGVFVFWQCLQAVDTLKSNIHANRRLHPLLVLDVAVMLACGAAIYVAVEAMVAWVEGAGSGVLGEHSTGWLTGWVMVLPNAILAIHYARTERAEVVYSSQLGDGHVCIPLCVGLAALGAPLAVPAFLNTGLIVIGVAVAVHAIVLAWNGSLSRPLGLALAGAYGWFLVAGFR